MLSSHRESERKIQSDVANYNKEIIKQVYENQRDTFDRMNKMNKKWGEYFTS